MAPILEHIRYIIKQEISHYGWYVYTIFIRILATGTINFSLAGVQLLFEGGSYYFWSDTSFCDIDTIDSFFKTNIPDIRSRNKQQNQARDIFCQTHLIVFAHACGYYSRVATISIAELHVWLLIRVRLLNTVCNLYHCRTCLWPFARGSLPE